jgi:hypothetical protein
MNLIPKRRRGATDPTALSLYADVAALNPDVLGAMPGFGQN